MTLIVTILIAAYYALSLWIACGFVAHGLTFAYFQRRWPRLAENDEDGDRAFARLVGSSGPIGLLVALIAGGTKYGLKF